MAANDSSAQGTSNKTQERENAIARVNRARDLLGHNGVNPQQSTYEQGLNALMGSDVDVEDLNEAQVKEFRLAWNRVRKQVETSEKEQGKNGGSNGSNGTKSRSKLEVEREAAVSKVRELLGDDADSAAPEEAMIALKKAEHPFYETIRSSSRQAGQFIQDFTATQPGSKKQARSWPAEAVKDELKSGREALTVARNGRSAEEIVTQLEEVKILADTMIAKLQSKEGEKEGSSE